MTKCLFSLTLVGLCVWLSACSGDGNVTEEDGLKGLPVTVADVDKFRKTLDQVVLDRDHGKFTKMVSKPDWFRKIFQGLDISSAVQRDVESVINRAGNVSALGREIFESLSKQGRYECVRVEVAGKQRSVIYRFVQANTKVVRYHRYDLVRTARNKICVEDIYFYVEDESLASLVRQQVVHLLKSKSRLEPGGKIDWPQQVDLYPLSTNEFKKLNELMVGQDWKQSWKKINSFPETIRGSKIVQIRRLLVAGKLGEEKFDEAVDGFRKRFPDHLFREYLAIEFYRQKESSQKMVEAVDRIIQRVKDPYLKLLKLEPLINLGEFELTQAIVDEFKANFQWSRVIGLHELALTVAEKDFGRSVEVLRKLKPLLGVRLENELKLPRYAELLKSRNYKEWKSVSED